MSYGGFAKLQLSDETLSFFRELSNLITAASALGGEVEARASNRYQSFLTSSASVGPAFAYLAAVASAALPPCTLDTPAEDIISDIDPVTHNLRLRCKHKSPHCWDLSGNSKPC